MKYRHSIINIISAACVSMTMLLSSCNGESEYSSQHECYFLFDTSIHNTSIIKNVLITKEPGKFVKISQSQKNGILCVDEELNDGKTKESNKITTAKETQRKYTLGIYNGIIVGYSSLGNGLYAFDNICPNCYDAGRYQQLTWDNNGTRVKCSRCQRTYDLNNGGIIVTGEQGAKLIRYMAQYTGGIGGIGGILVVHNKQ